jgi:Family of unknown function (DUF6011)
MAIYSVKVEFIVEAEPMGPWAGEQCACAWIDREPTWYPGAANYQFLTGGKDGKDTFPDPTYPCKRLTRLSLIGGGQIRTTEHFIRRNDKVFPIWCQKIDLKIIAHTEAGVVTVFGHINQDVCFEMCAQAVVLRGKKHQEIADRTAATLRAIDSKLENFYALLDGSNGCAICGRPLRDEISKLVGVGPECASKHNVPHNLRAAEDRLALRKKLLGGASYSLHV